MASTGLHTSPVDERNSSAISAVRRRSRWRRPRRRSTWSPGSSAGCAIRRKNRHPTCNSSATAAMLLCAAVSCQTLRRAKGDYRQLLTLA